MFSGSEDPPALKSRYAFSSHGASAKHGIWLDAERVCFDQRMCHRSSFYHSLSCDEMGNGLAERAVSTHHGGRDPAFSSHWV